MRTVDNAGLTIALMGMSSIPPNRHLFWDFDAAILHSGHESDGHDVVIGDHRGGGVLEELGHAGYPAAVSGRRTWYDIQRNAFFLADAGQCFSPDRILP